MGSNPVEVLKKIFTTVMIISSFKFEWHEETNKET